MGKDAVDRRLSTLRDRYGKFSVERRERTVPSGAFEGNVEHVRTCEVADVRVWIERDGEVLLARDRDAPEVWLEPGGTVEPDERIEAAARREVAEETGIDCRLRGVRGTCRHVHRHAADPSRVVHLLGVYYRAEYAGGDLDVQDAEILEGRWWSSLPEGFHSDVGPPDGWAAR